MAAITEADFAGAGANFRVAGYTVTSAGQASVAVTTPFSAVKFAVCGWKATPSNPTFQVYVYSVSGNVVNIRCTDASEAASVWVLVFGYN